MNPNTMISKLTGHEGRKLRMYKDSVGKWTIGVGRNIEDVGISNDECDMLLLNDINRIWKELVAALPLVQDLSEKRQHALLDMAFMGVGKVMGFHDMITALERQDYNAAANEMLNSVWATQVGKRAQDDALDMRIG